MANGDTSVLSAVLALVSVMSAVPINMDVMSVVSACDECSTSECDECCTCEYECVSGVASPQFEEVNGVPETQGRVPGEDDARRLHLHGEPLCGGKNREPSADWS